MADPGPLPAGFPEYATAEAAAAFTAEYARRSNVTVEFLEENGKRAFPCACGEEGCKGWAMLSRDTWSDPDALWLATRVVGTPPPKNPPERVWQ